MSQIVFTIGQHRNEKSAIYLGPSVARGLEEMGHNLVLTENPEKRTFLEIVLATSNEGRRLEEVDVYNLLFGWEDQIDKLYPNHSIFLLHTYGINPTIFTPKEMFTVLQEAEEDHPNFSVLDNLINNPLAKLVHFGYALGTTIVEIPEVTKNSISKDELKSVKKGLDNKTFELYSDYLLDTNIEATRKQGWLGKEIINVLVSGIDFLVKKGYDIKEYWRLKNHNWI